MASGQLSRASVGASRGLVFQRSLFIPQRYASASVSTRRAVQTATGQLSPSDILRRQSASGYIGVRRASEHLTSRAVLPPLLPSSLLTTMGDETTPFTPEQMAWLLPRLQPPSSSPAATADGTTPPTTVAGGTSATGGDQPSTSASAAPTAGEFILVVSRGDGWA